MSQGELILASKVSEFGEKVTIVQSLGPNSRAMSIKVDAVTAVGGFVTPGDSVDIMLTQGSAGDMRAVTILQNVRVLGVDQDSDEQNDQVGVARTVTVEVSPEESQKLALAQKAGTLSLSLRTLDGVIDAPLDSIRLSDLMREKSPVDEEVVKKTIRIRRATDAVETVDVE
jgi:pilus assembly protein CpaB